MRIQSQRAPGRPLNPLELPRNAGRPGRESFPRPTRPEGCYALHPNFCQPRLRTGERRRSAAWTCSACRNLYGNSRDNDQNLCGNSRDNDQNFSSSYSGMSFARLRQRNPGNLPANALRLRIRSQRAPGRPLNPLEPPRNAGRQARPEGRNVLRPKLTPAAA